jgi:hypothetical protein
MARYNLPAHAAGTAVNPQQIVTPTTNPQQVVFQNVGAANVWVSENQSTIVQLDTSGNPIAGLILQPNTPPTAIDRVSGPLYAFCPAGGAIECIQWNAC